MNIYQISFTVFSTLDGLVWLLIIFAPRWQMTQKMLNSLWIIVPFMLSYAVLELPYVTTALPLFARPQLPAIMRLLGSQPGAALAWLHFIAADLFVGRWVYLDSRRNDMNIFLMAPILFFTAMLCPLGFILYLAARAVARPKAVMA